MNRFLVACGVVAMLAFPVFASAQDTHAPSKVADFHLSTALKVGTTTLKPGDYKFQCIFVDGGHFMVVKSEDGKEVARVPCTPEDLGRRNEVSEFRSITRPDGTRDLSAVRFKGETISHRVAT
ncbi:MAG: hypothetical protein LAO77_17730 [Acidobacteriia bacterium]|nr:hypothetical protein [Terriglobia bacterium]